MAERPRECGECSACCTLIAVPEIGKKENAPCPNAKKDEGCAIHESRPESCRAYSCLWLAEGSPEIVPESRLRGKSEIPTLLRNMDRPDRVGVVVDVLPPDSEFSRFSGYPSLLLRSARPHAFSEPEARGLVRRLRRRAVVVCVSMDGRERKILGPEHAMRRLERARVK
jgi:hypothetical protein